LPVYEEDFDKVIGILYVKDLLGYTVEGKDFDWLKLIRDQVLYVPESKKIDDLLREFQLKRMHMAIVVDEYGGSCGIVTLEDIMEEVIGDIKDEFDEDEEVEYVKLDNQNFIFDGKMLLNDVLRITGLPSDIFDEIKGDSDSLAGLIIEKIGHLPKPETEVEIGNIKFTVISTTAKRIEKVNLRIESHEA
ncbi:MAG TPA: transporter associated domain-containing protein, partial [Saprospiraceae bacterium]|nr:transporter associated domain-containing protein [Saprospiraceae bacterium]